VIGPKKRMALFINFLIECEYRRPNSKWVFFERIYSKSYDEKNTTGLPSDILSDIVYFVTDSKTKWAKVVSSELTHAIEKHLSFPEANGFAESFGKKMGKFKRTDEPFLQVAKGLLYRFRDSAESQEDKKFRYEYGEIWYEAYIPIVVTTAEINICNWDYKDINEFEQKAELYPQDAIKYELRLSPRIIDMEIPSFPIIVLHSDSLKEFVRRITNSIRSTLEKVGMQISETFYVYVGKTSQN
jgi:hypothetical protein